MPADAARKTLTDLESLQVRLDGYNHAGDSDEERLVDLVRRARNLAETVLANREGTPRPMCREEKR